jgi:hypothetical protein
MSASPRKRPRERVQIIEGKVRTPAAAMALIERLKA